jgi:hypothetical protein
LSYQIDKMSCQIYILSYQFDKMSCQIYIMSYQSDLMSYQIDKTDGLNTMAVHKHLFLP